MAFRKGASWRAAGLVAGVALLHLLATGAALLGVGGELGGPARGEGFARLAFLLGFPLFEPASSMGFSLMSRLPLPLVPAALLANGVLWGLGALVACRLLERRRR